MTKTIKVKGTLAVHFQHFMLVSSGGLDVVRRVVRIVLTPYRLVTVLVLKI